ncbi:glycosyltransferase family 2 protein [Puniceicoccus vermicola]|uniref:Glycosyltransferase family 2 protein n=1 Tax=Puniceicoccus vermicola TaxID=388746 RepID=A0A7X1AW17_9BACT|nr:glycosyltransferase family 2 protein [Puniceicoccus vermicola]MBC2601043.1 glycosyltransferase family 2 protein [Puniceicoccus vermicola]
MSANRPIVIIPSYNTGGTLLRKTVEGVLAHTEIPLLLVIDGSTDGSGESVAPLAAETERFSILTLPQNRGKGAAVLVAAEAALKEGATHAVIVDADGQHPPDEIDPMIRLLPEEEPAMIMGLPQFGSDAPLARLWGRKLSIFWTDVVTLWGGLGDTLFGMRVYPLQSFCTVLRKTRFARGFDFDPEIAVRLYWEGVRPIQHPVPCRYLSKDEGGVSHFHYLRDNVKLTFLVIRLLSQFVFFYLWKLLFRKR